MPPDRLAHSSTSHLWCEAVQRIRSATIPCLQLPTVGTLRLRVKIKAQQLLKLDAGMPQQWGWGAGGGLAGLLGGEKVVEQPTG